MSAGMGRSTTDRGSSADIETWVLCSPNLCPSMLREGCSEVGVEWLWIVSTTIAGRRGDCDGGLDEVGKKKEGPHRGLLLSQPTKCPGAWGVTNGSPRGRVRRVVFHRSPVSFPLLVCLIIHVEEGKERGEEAKNLFGTSLSFSVSLVLPVQSSDPA